MKKDIGKFFEGLTEKKLIQINIDLSNGEYDGIIQSVSQVLIDEYGVDSSYVSTVIRNYVNGILSNRYVKLKSKKK